MQRQYQWAVNDDFQVTGALDDRDAHRQYRHVVELDALQLLTATLLHNLCFIRVQSQSAGSHRLVDITDSLPPSSDWNADG